MRLNNILSGAAFKSAISSLLFYLLALILAGIAIYHITKLAMMQELEWQISEEIILFQEIYENGGQTALIDSVKKLENQPAPIPRLIGLFDDHSSKLGGNMDLAPDYIGWKTTRLSIKQKQQSIKFHTFSGTIDSSTIVIGRHMKLVDAVLRSLLWVLISAAILVSICTLLTGYFASRRVFFKLDRLASTLDEISKGETKARLYVDQSNDQIDRISIQINHYLDQLSSLLDSTRNTAISIAHDLRTPLNRIHLMVQEVKDCQGDEEQKEKLLSAVEQEIKVVSEIFDTILRISRIESNKDQSDFKILFINHLLKDMFEIYEAVVEEASQTLVYNPDPDSPDTIKGDNKMLRQLLANLIENAIFYCPEGTTITLSSSHTSNNTISLQVSDNGMGIPDEKRQKALDPFYRLNSSRNQPGNGLGLALVKAITIRHQAKIELMDNDPGLRVCIQFPAANIDNSSHLK